MKVHELLTAISMIIDALVRKKATGMYFLQLNFSQGGINSYKYYGAVKTPKDSALFISNNGAVNLKEIK